MVFAALASSVLLATPQQDTVPRDTVRLPDLAVTATHLPVDRGNLPVRVTVIAGARLRAQGVVFVSDALAALATAHVVRTGSYGGVTSLFLRGGESDYVKVMVDGVTLNRPGGGIDLAHLTTSQVDRIEIIEGPASVVHGADAMSGVIQIFTRGGGPQRVEADVQVGTLGSVGGTVTAVGGKPGTDYALSLGGFGSGGPYDFNDGYRNWAGSARASLRPGRSTTAALTARYHDARAEFPTDFAGVPGDSNQFSTERSLALGLTATQSLSRMLEARIEAGGHSGTYGYQNRSDSPGDTLGFGYAADTETRVRRGSLDLRLIARPGDRLAVTAGARLEREGETSQTAVTSNFGGVFEDRQAFEADRLTSSGYLETWAGLGARVSLTGAVRVDDNSAFGGFTTYRAGATWRPTATTALRASVGTGFKAPTFSELFANTPFEVGNPALSPERSMGWEAGASQALAHGAVELHAIWFDQRFRDLIQYQFTALGEPTYANLASAKAWGLVAGAEAAVSGVSLRGEYSYLHTQALDAAEPSVGFATGQRLLRRPTHSGRLGLGYDAGWVDLTWAVMLVGTRDDVDFTAFPAERVTLPGYTLTDMALFLPLAGESGSGVIRGASLRVENLLGTDYQTVSGFPGLGRVVRLGVRFELGGLKPSGNPMRLTL